jgi:hypothetical protein
VTDTRLDAERPAYWPEIKILLLAGMLFFVFTIGIGILNGTDLVDFEHQRLLGHVHSGTLGWLTMSVFAASLWLFGEDVRDDKAASKIRLMVWAAILSFGLYVVAFTFTYNEFRPAMGAISTLVIAAFFVWIATRAKHVTLGVPHIGFLAAVATSVVGGVLGVLWGLMLATGDQYLPTGGEDAHPAIMVVGFLFPVALAMIEWAFTFPNPPKANRLGVIQMVFPFTGGIILALSLLLDVDAMAPLAILLEVIGVVIFVVRMWSHFRGVRIAEASSGRWALFAAVGSVFVIGLAQYFVIKYEADFDLVPEHELLALDHSQFIASMTSAIFAMLVAAIGSRIPARLQHLVFGMVTIGLTIFVIGLLGDTTALKRIGAPTMGTGLLIGLGCFAWALTQDRPKLTAAAPAPA